MKDELMNVGILCRFPLLGMANELTLDFRPVVQIGGVEIRVVRPDKSPHFGIESHLVEECRVAQGGVDFAVQNRLEVNGLLGIVIEPYPQGMRSDNFEVGNMINKVFHLAPRNLPERFDGKRFLAAVQQFSCGL